MTPKISVVIPVYNAAKYLRECLDSICSQTFKDWEVVAVDDGSPDECPSILDEYAARDERFRVIHKVNGGVSAARNDGLAVALGEYVLFVDSDDFLETNTLEVSYQEALRVDADVVITDHWNWKEGTHETLHHFFSEDFVADTREGVVALMQTVLYRGYSPYPSSSCSYMFSALWTKLIRRRILVDNGIQFSREMKLYEDGLVALQVLNAARKVAYKHIPTYHYRILNNSLCHINEDRLVTDCDIILKNVNQFLQVVNAENPSASEQELLLDAFYARALFLTKKMALRSFFSKGAEGGFFKRYGAYKGILKKEPYCSAVKKIPALKLCGNEKTFGKLIGHGLVFMTALMYELKARLLRR